MDAVVVGASGGIGAALVRQLAADGRFARVHALARRQPAMEAQGVAAVAPGQLDLVDEASIADAAARIADLAGPGGVGLVIVATGLLHAPGVQPEKALRSLDGAALAQLFAVNATGPALVAKHFLPLLPRHGRAAFAALSARVGSITDNHLGGWHGYRASKAALNMLIRTISIELTRTRPDSLCVALHPGTVATGLSAPFQGGVRPERLFTPDFAAARLLAVLDGLNPSDTGGCFAWDGTPIPP